MKILKYFFTDQFILFSFFLSHSGQLTLLYIINQLPVGENCDKKILMCMFIDTIFKEDLHNTKFCFETKDTFRPKC